MLLLFPTQVGQGPSGEDSRLQGVGDSLRGLVPYTHGISCPSV